MHQYLFKLWFTVHKKIRNNFLLNYYCFPRQAVAYHLERCRAERYSEKSTSQSFSTVIRKPTVPLGNNIGRTHNQSMRSGIDF